MLPPPPAGPIGLRWRGGLHAGPLRHAVRPDLPS